MHACTHTHTHTLAHTCTCTHAHTHICMHLKKELTGLNVGVPKLTSNYEFPVDLKNYGMARSKQDLILSFHMAWHWEKWYGERLVWHGTQPALSRPPFCVKVKNRILGQACFAPTGADGGVHALLQNTSHLLHCGVRMVGKNCSVYWYIYPCLLNI